MDIVYLLIPLSLALAVLIFAVLWWAVDSGQFDDLESPASRILMDDDGQAEPGAIRGCASVGKPPCAAAEPARRNGTSARL
jgi:cbb3-type cytochrome oxidase maturation protein